MEGYDFNPRPSHEGRLPVTWAIPSVMSISIHVPHTRDDEPMGGKLRNCDRFQSTSLTRGTTGYLSDIYCRRVFQSTSLTRGTTTVTFSRIARKGNFNPRPSHEGRPERFAITSIQALFQSTSLTRGTTLSSGPFSTSIVISIHVPHTRDDLGAHILGSYATVFQSTSLTRGTTLSKFMTSAAFTFQSTSLTRGTTGGKTHA